jgi:hypothetical protein
MILTQNAPPSKTHIRYDRSAKQWQAVNGTVTSHPTKKEALLKALANDHPRLAEVVTSLIRLHGDAITARAIKAAQLITHNRVFDGMVRSQTQPDTYYKIRFDGAPRSYKCDCPDGRLTDAHLGEVCKHTLAAHLAYIAGIELADAPIPFDGEAVIIHGAAGMTDASNVPF